jgi:hypothetical protein
MTIKFTAAKVHENSEFPNAKNKKHDHAVTLQKIMFA